MNMRPSRVLKKLRAGENVMCVKLNLADVRVAEIAAMCGIDCIWLDMEHVPADWQTIENQIRAAKTYDVDALVRISKGSYSDYVRPLEADAAGIMVPHLMSLKEAKDIVRTTRFHPIGRRPVDGGNADGGYCMVDFNDYLKTANQQRFVIVQIEDPEPLDELEEIAKLDGIDMLFFGPGDFSQGIGKPGQWDDPLISQTRKRIAEVAKANGKFAGTVGGPGNVKELNEMGYQFVNLGADVIALGQYFKNIVSSVSDIAQNESKSIYGKD
ncbi:MAG: HpcH/HpaI aldolase/citrate lyase family protein [Sedimentisphaeraceae bacterium JB056]